MFPMNKNDSQSSLPRNLSEEPDFGWFYKLENGQFKSVTPSPQASPRHQSASLPAFTGGLKRTPTLATLTAAQQIVKNEKLAQISGPEQTTNTQTSTKAEVVKSGSQLVLVSG